MSRFICRAVNPRAVALVAIACAIVAQPITSPIAGAAPTDVRSIQFPVEGSVSFWNDWGAPRSGGRTHAGNDLMGHKLQPLLAAADGVVRWTRTDGNNMLALEDADGWEYWYIHINNDTPGTDDGANPPQWILFPNIREGSYVLAGQPIAYLGDSGNAEGTSPHLHFEMHAPDGTAVNPYASLLAARRGPRVRGVGAAVAAGGGHWVLDNLGYVHAFGGAPHHGQPAFGWDVARDIAAMPDGNGYVVLDGWGGVHRYGSASSLGGISGPYFAGQDLARAVSVTPDGKGWLVVDAWGGVHRAGSATSLPKAYDPYWPGWDIVRDIDVMPDGKGYVILDGWGGLHKVGSAGESLAGQSLPYWPGWDIAREVIVAGDGEGVALLDGWGGVHSRGSLASLGSKVYEPGSSWRGLATRGRRVVVVSDAGTSTRWS